MGHAGLWATFGVELQGSDMSHSLKLLKGGYTGDYIGDYYRGY